MKRNLIHAAALALALMVCTACGSPDKQETPNPPKPPELPPYEYDDDTDYDPGEFLNAYKGAPHKGPHRVPGTLETEDFDDGANNAAWYESDSKPADPGYRGTHAVDVRAEGTASGGYYIGDVQPGEWMSYTIEADEDGTYSIDTYCVKGDGSEGGFYFEVDGRGASRSVNMPLGGWTDMSRKATATGIQLTKGKHVLKYCANTPGNVDRFVFTRTGELQGRSGSATYPMTKPMTNPLFVEFPSPMYNSWLTGPLYTADASAHVWNIGGKEVLYVYASHDMEPALGCDRMDRYHVFSTEDMVNWTDHGEIMNAATVRLQAGWGSDGFMWAPDCAYNPADETYYFYFPHPSDTERWNTTWRIGVATSKYPDREFRVAGYVEGMPPHIDPCVFVDDDGQPYIYNGGGGKCYGGKLRKDDWTRLDGTMKQMTGLEDFHEAAWIHKHNGKYYLSHSDNNSPDRGGNRMKYAVSDSPLGPWKNMGVYLHPTGVETNHGSIVNFKGQWYAFYHAGNYSGQGNLRSVCVDPVTMRPDGSLEVVRNWGTAPGGMPVRPGGEPLRFEAENHNEGGYHYAWFTKASRAAPSVVTKNSRTYIEGLQSGEWVRYSFDTKSAGKYSVECILSSARGDSRFVVSINGSRPAADGIRINTATGVWGSSTVSDLELSAGESYLEFRVTGGSVNIDSFTVTKR